jgi:hypothetical protein
MPNHKAFRHSRKEALKRKHKQVERFERLLRREHKQLKAIANQTSGLIARFPSNSATYLKDWFAALEVFQKNVTYLESQIRRAGLCPVRVPFTLSHAVAFSAV